MEYSGLRRRAPAICFCVLLLALASACRAAGEDSSGKQNMKEVSHPNGLALRLPDSLAARQTADGFIIEPAGADNDARRYPMRASLSLRADGSEPPGEWPLERRIGSRRLRYRIDKAGGGSGGVEYVFDGWEAVSGSYLFCRQREQSESGEPKFELCWQALEGASLRPAK